MRKKKCRWVTYLAAGLLAGLLGLWNTGTASAQVEEPRPLKVAFPRWRVSVRRTSTADTRG